MVAWEAVNRRLAGPKAGKQASGGFRAMTFQQCIDVHYVWIICGVLYWNRGQGELSRDGSNSWLPSFRVSHRGQLGSATVTARVADSLGIGREDGKKNRWHLRSVGVAMYGYCCMYAVAVRSMSCTHQKLIKSDDDGRSVNSLTHWREGGNTNF